MLHTDFESTGKLEDLLERDVSKYSNIFIDESHRFRTETNQTYEMLAQICRRKRVILVSATLLNNTPRDILSQLKLFQNGKNSTIPNVRTTVKVLKPADPSEKREPIPHDFYTLLKKINTPLRRRPAPTWMTPSLNTEAGRTMPIS